MEIGPHGKDGEDAVLAAERAPSNAIDTVKRLQPKMEASHVREEMARLN